MNIYKSIKLIFNSLENRKNMLVLCIILFLPTLAACSETVTTEIDEISNNSKLSEIEPVGVDENYNDLPSETESPPTIEPSTVGGGKIAFWTSKDGNGEIYLMDADGSNLINLTNNDANDLYPTWSPDGTKIAFTSNRDSDYENTGVHVSEIYVMEADGSNQVRLTNNDISESKLDWSPDGEKIVFDSNWDKVLYDNPILNWKGLEIGMIDADGSNIVRLTNNTFRDDSPSWSPDGSKIVFSSDRDGEGFYSKGNTYEGYTGSYANLAGDSEIYVMDADGSNVIRLTHDNWVNSLPDWSPDGSRIVFYSARNGKGVICLMDVDGSNETCLENNIAFEHAYGPEWSPDGNKILFSTNGSLGKEIYSMNPDGSVLKRLVGGGQIGLPVWQP